jgi:riboflavin kinase/FMN adenylyltransferase
MNIPTANIALKNLNQLIPAKGVYCVDTNVDNHNYSGMCNIGVRPTFYEDGDSIIEVHLITDDKLSLYGKEIQIKLKKFIREEKKYKYANELVKQLKRDRYTCLPN